MPFVKGLALMSRLEYLESKFGINKYREFLKKISTDEVNFVKQPVDGALIYPESTLTKIDQILLEDYFKNDLNEFRKVGIWSADNFMYRYFSLYIDASDPQGFLEQYARLRECLIGSGEISIDLINENHLKLNIDYAQPVPKSICLSEQGFLEGGMKHCGAKKVKISEYNCASESNNFICNFDIILK